MHGLLAVAEATHGEIPSFVGFALTLATFVLAIGVAKAGLQRVQKDVEQLTSEVRNLTTAVATLTAGSKDVERLEGEIAALDKADTRLSDTMSNLRERVAVLEAGGRPVAQPRRPDPSFASTPPHGYKKG